MGYYSTECGNDSASEARSKAKKYAFLAQVLSSHPTQDTLKGIRQMALSLGIAFPDDFSLIELGLEYIELFVVPSPRYVAPYESVFLNRRIPPVFRNAKTDLMIPRWYAKGLAMEGKSKEVRRVYIRMGVFPDNDLPDHIANELSFMAYLCLKEAGASAEKVSELSELRKKFCEEHPLMWMSLLRERVMKNEHLGFYSFVLKVAEVSLRNEIDEDERTKDEKQS